MARQIAREYAPEFRQPGPDFIKQRAAEMSAPLNGLSSTTSRSRSVGAGGRQLTRQRHIEEFSPARPIATTLGSGGLQLPDGVLQVGVGGSRRGSFRRSPAANRARSVQPASPSAASAAAAAEAPAAKSLAPRMQLSDAVSRLKMNSVAAGASRGGAVSATRDHVEPLPRVLDIAPTSDHFDQYRAGPSIGRKKRDSGLGRDSSFEDSPHTTSAAAHSNSVANANVNVNNIGCGNNRGDSDSGLSEVSGGSLNRCRRRAIPSSLAGAPPARPPLTGPPELEDAMHCSDCGLPDEHFTAHSTAHSSRHSCCCCCCCRCAEGNGTRSWATHDDVATAAANHRSHSQPNHHCRSHQHRHHHRGPASAEGAAAARDRRLQLLRMEEQRLLGEAEAEADAEAKTDTAGISEAKATTIDTCGGLSCSRCCRCASQLEAEATTLRRVFDAPRQPLPSPPTLAEPTHAAAVVAMAGASCGSSSVLSVAARLSAAAAARACWRTVRWLRSNAGDWFQEHLLLLFVLIINTGLAILVFSLLANGHQKTP